MSYSEEAMSIISDFVLLKPRLIKVLKRAHEILKSADAMVAENERLKARISELENIIDKSNSKET